VSLESWFPEEVEPRPLEREGVRLRVPEGWEARIAQQLETGDGERSFQVLHASTVPLSGPRADYGGGVVERLGHDDVFVSLIEFGPDEAGSALFKEVDTLPVLEVGQFHRNQLQRRIRGQAGVQHFFTYQGRPYCLYVVLGSIARAPELVVKANALLEGLAVDSA
jgi:hypothetical protein